MPEVVMPRLSDSMEEGTIVRWLKRDGERVSRGEPLAEVETDEATVTFGADVDGTLHILVGEGETVPIGGLIARIGEPASPGQPAGRPANGRSRASPLARRMARDSGVDLTPVAGSGPGGRTIKSDVTAAGPPAAAIPPAPSAVPVSEGVPAREAVPTREALPARAATNKGAVTIHQPTRAQVQIAQRVSESRPPPTSRFRRTSTWTPR